MSREQLASPKHECTMRYGSAIAEKVVDGCKYVICVRVGMAQPSEQVGHRIRLAPGINESSASAGAWSGVLFAQRRGERESYDIELQEISGDIDCPMAGMGAAIAATVAAWVACGDDWQESDLGDMHGWSLRRPA
jgi:hypothetical protein